jgi:hypothetical protein
VQGLLRKALDNIPIEPALRRGVGEEVLLDPAASGLVGFGSDQQRLGVCAIIGARLARRRRPSTNFSVLPKRLARSAGVFFSRSMIERNAQHSSAGFIGRWK